jgi:hypothetical protein
VADLQAQRADGVVDDLGLVGAEEDDVAVLGAGALEDRGERGVVQVLDDRRLQAVAALGLLVDLDPGQALGAVDATNWCRRRFRRATARRPGTRRPRHGRPSHWPAENTLKSTSFIASVSSVNSSLTRRSGLSEPKRAIASEYGITGNLRPARRRSAS